MHATLDDLTKFLLALTGCFSALGAVISAMNNKHLRQQTKQMDKQDEKMAQLSEDVNGRVTQLIESEAAKAKLEAVVNMKQKE